MLLLHPQTQQGQGRKALGKEQLGFFAENAGNKTLEIKTSGVLGMEFVAHIFLKPKFLQTLKK